MAQIKLHGRKAYIIHYFNNLPSLIVDEFEMIKDSPVKDLKVNKSRHSWADSQWESWRNKKFTNLREKDVE